MKSNIGEYILIPSCTVDENGEIVKANETIYEVFIYDNIVGGSIYALTGISYEKLNNTSLELPLIEQDGKKFRLEVEKSENEEIKIYFYDVTEYEIISEKYNNEKICIMKISIDNYEEMMQALPYEKRMLFSAEIDKIVRAWSSTYDSSINSLKSDSYIIHFMQKHLDDMVKTNFKILEDIRNIDFQTDFPPSLSIGVGVGGDSFMIANEYADFAMDLALGRGGDQAVVKKEDDVSFFGGKTQAVEIVNKRKSRVVAHALKRLISTTEKIFIMGHAFPDMDSFSSALGIYKMCMEQHKDAYIVINKYNEAIDEIMMTTKKMQVHNIITGKEAESMISHDDLLVVVDTSRSSHVDHPPLLSKVDRVIIIDHHRKSEDSILSPALSLIETYASSTAEIVTEILRYAELKSNISKFESEALMAGIIVDTNGFSINTGVRTFESAAWLKKSGADTTATKRFFQSDIENFRLISKSITETVINPDGIAFAICPDNHDDVQITNARIADELINIKGVVASFVAGENNQGDTFVSARSLGDVNVQIIMEKYGGGGHLNIAGAKLKTPAEKLIQELKDNMHKFMQ